jgi:hypothetical protein
MEKTGILNADRPKRFYPLTAWHWQISYELMPEPAYHYPPTEYVFCLLLPTINQLHHFSFINPFKNSLLEPANIKPADEICNSLFLQNYNANPIPAIGFCWAVGITLRKIC